MRFTMIAIVLLLLGRSAEAQIVTAPTDATFAHPDADFAITSGYRMEFFQCSSVTPGPPPVCVGRASQPFQTTGTVPKTLVTGPATARHFLFADVQGAPLASLPVAFGFVSALVAVGDTSAGGSGESQRSGDSNPFFARGRNPATPTGLTVR